MSINANFPIKIERNGNQIIINWARPVDITQNLTIKAKKTTSYTTKSDAVVVVYREKI